MDHYGAIAHNCANSDSDVYRNPVQVRYLQRAGTNYSYSHLALKLENAADCIAFTI